MNKSFKSLLTLGFSESPLPSPEKNKEPQFESPPARMEDLEEEAPLPVSIKQQPQELITRRKPPVRNFPPEDDGDLDELRDDGMVARPTPRPSYAPVSSALSSSRSATHVSRADKAKIHEAGFQDLLDRHGRKPFELYRLDILEVDLHLEENDPMQRQRKKIIFIDNEPS